MANSSLTYIDPLFIVWRKGTLDDPYVTRTDSIKIVNKSIVLLEVPDKFNHVTIPGYSEIYLGDPTSTQFIVDYATGFVTFNISEEARTVAATYKGRGLIMYPASRVRVHNSNPDVVQSIQDIVDNGNAAIIANQQLTATLTNVQTATTNANTATTNANNAATAANTAKTNADTATTAANTAAGAANTAKTNADAATIAANNAATAANTAKTNTDTATTNATTATTNANNAATAANTAKTNADTATTNATTATTNANTATTNANTAATNTSYKGAWSSATAYKKNNSVLSGNTTYVCILDAPAATAVTNTTYWQVGPSTQAAIDSAATATTAANTATGNANTAATAANTAKTNADTATSNATTATTNANTATTNANTATASANTATTNANTAANDLVGLQTWTSATAYKKRNIVSYNGSGYLALSDHANQVPTNVTYWQPIGTKGDIGPTGLQGPVGATWKNVYNAATQYAVSDEVSLNGSSYICITIPPVGTAPPNATYWGILALKGTDGAGTGTVTNVTSANADISIATSTSTPVLTLNVGTAANQIAKRDVNGAVPGNITGDAASVGGQTLANLDGRYAAAAHTHTFASLTTKPTTLSGYGITDAALSTHTHTFASLTSIPTTLSGYGITDAATATHTHAFSSLTSIPTTLAGHGITDAVLASDVVTAAAASKILKLDANSKLPASITGDAGSVGGQTLTNLDARYAAASHTHTFASLTSKPTTVSGYGITDAAALDGNGRVADSVKVGGVYVRYNSTTLAAEWSNDNVTWNGFGLDARSVRTIARRY